MRQLFLAVLTGLWATGALAHSAMDRSTPANKATISDVPSQVTMGFTGGIRLTKVAVAHAGKNSAELDLGAQTEFGQEFTLPLKDLGSGEYVIEWRGLGTDGHVLNGAFSFTVE